MATEALSHWFKLTPADTALSPAIYIDDHAIDYLAMSQRVDWLVQQLRKQSVGQGHRLALMSSSTSLHYLMTHATAALGATFYPLDPALPTAWQQALLNTAAVDYRVSCDSSFDINSDTSLFSVTALGQGGEVSEAQAAPAVMVATSGSSGEPKTVMLSSQSVYNSALAVNQRVDLTTTDCWLNCLPLYHIGGLSIIYRTALAGASMVLHQGFDAGRVWRDIRQYQVSHLSLVPVMLAKLLAVADSAPPRHLRVVLVGGAALDDDLAHRALAAGWPLFLTYGMSETGSQVATQALTTPAINEPISLLAGVECAVINAMGEPTGGIGRIRFRGKLLMQGYANASGVAGEGLDADGWYTTGDLGCYEPEKGIQVVGRADAVIVSGGNKIHPQALEQLMSACPGVDEVCVLGVVDAEWGERVCAVYTGELDEPALEHWCRQNLGTVQRPRLFVRVPQLPRLASGKLDRYLLRQQYRR
ncbi:MAG: acyl--CoA ligase [Gammaproteobacteria bacterium]|nr:acyl--CoA ligase [Gammaproteobacteria bacterium]